MTPHSSRPQRNRQARGFRSILIRLRSFHAGLTAPVQLPSDLRDAGSSGLALAHWVAFLLGTGVVWRVSGRSCRQRRQPVSACPRLLSRVLRPNRYVGLHRDAVVP